MNYTMSINVYREVLVDDKKNQAEPTYKKETVSSFGFNLTTPTKEGTYTGTEIKNLVKTSMKLPDDIKDVKLSSKGKELVDANPVTDYSVNFSFTYPYVAPLVKDETPGATASTGATSGK